MSTFIQPESVTELPVLSREPVRKQMIIPLVDILEQIDRTVADRWCDNDPYTAQMVRASISHALHAWCKHGWTILLNAGGCTHQQALVLMTELWRAEETVGNDNTALAIFKSLYPIMRAFSDQDRLILDTLNPMFTEPNNMRRIGGDIFLEACYINTY